jgi:hypothetical protein
MCGHELRTFHLHACVDRADHLGALRLRSRCPERAEVAQSSDHAARLHTRWRGRRRAFLIAQPPDGCQILGVVQVACGVRKRNLLPLPPDAPKSKLVGWRSGLRHVPDDALDGRVVQGERGQLGGQGPVPSVGAISATVSLDVWQRIFVALDRPLLIEAGRGALEETADAGHLAMQELILRLARASGVSGAFELPVPAAAGRNSIDVSSFVMSARAGWR